MGKYNISLTKIMEICEGSDEVCKIGNLSALKDYFCHKTTKGLWLKDIMKEVGVPEGEIPSEKEKRISWIIKNVHIEGLAENVLELSEPEAEQEAVEEPGQIFKSCKLSRDDVNRFIGRLEPGCFRNVEGELDISRTALHEGLSVEFQDNFLVQYKPGFYEGLVAILKKDKNEVAAIF